MTDTTTEHVRLKHWLSTLTMLVLVMSSVHFYRTFEASPITENKFTIQDLQTEIVQIQQVDPSNWKVLPASGIGPLTQRGQSFWIHSRIPPVPKDQDLKTLVADVGDQLVEKIEIYLISNRDVIHSKVVAINPQQLDTSPPQPHLQYHFKQHHSNWLDLYIRTEAKAPVSIRYSLLQEDTNKRLTRQRVVLIGVILGAILTLLLRNLVLGGILRERMFFLYVGFELTLLLFHFTINSPPQSLAPWLINKHEALMRFGLFLLALSNIAFLHFSNSILSLGIHIPRLSRSLYVIDFTIALMAIGLQFVPYQVSIPIMQLSTLALIIPSSWSLISHINHRHIFHFLSACLGLYSLTIYAAFVHGGFFETTWLRTQSSLIAHLWSVISFSFALGSKRAAMYEEQQAILSAIRTQKPLVDSNKPSKSKSLRSTHRTEINVTIMSIDAVSFSHISRRLGAKESFGLLAEFINQINTIISSHGGLIERSLGDGLIAIFGYGLNTPHFNHARKALRAAVAIQRQILNRACHVFDNEKAPLILPARIGIHSTTTIITNDNSTSNTFSIAGNGVEFAKNLQSACSPFRIAISNETRKNLELSDAKATLNPVLANPVVSNELVTIYEYNPFLHRQFDLAIAERRLANQSSIERQDQRNQVPARKKITLRCESSIMQVIDYSLSGFRVVTTERLGRLTNHEVHLMLPDLKLNALLKSKLLTTFTVQVRWSKEMRDGEVHHGLQALSMNQEQKELIHSLIMSFRDAA